MLIVLVAVWWHSQGGPAEERRMDQNTRASRLSEQPKKPIDEIVQKTEAKVPVVIHETKSTNKAIVKPEKKKTHRTSREKHVRLPEPHGYDYNTRSRGRRS